MGYGRFANRLYGNGMTGRGVVEDGWVPAYARTRGRGGGKMGPRIREDNGGGGGYMRPGIFSPPVRLPSFWPAIS